MRINRLLGMPSQFDNSDNPSANQPDSEEITRKAKSNLAFALGILPKEQRRDVTIFYAYCRSIDDLADDEGIPEAERRAALAEWKQGLIEGFEKKFFILRPGASSHQAKAAIDPCC